MESVLEKMKREGAEEKIAAFKAKQKLPYEAKVKYAQLRAEEFVRECDRRGLGYHVSVGGLDSITLVYFLRSIGIDCPAVSCSLLEDESIRRIHRKLGVVGLYPVMRDKDKNIRWTKPTICKSLAFRCCQRRLRQRLSCLQIRLKRMRRSDMQS